MKKILFTLLLSFLFLGNAVKVIAAENTGSIAVVDIKKILNESSATKSIQKQIEEKRKAVQTEVGKEEEKLRKADKELAEQRTVLAQDVFEKKVQEFKTDVVEAQRDVQTKRAQLETAYTNALGEVEKVVVSIISEMAEKKGFSVAIPKTNALYSSDSLDISDEVLKILNQRLPDVKVKLQK